MKMCGFGVLLGGAGAGRGPGRGRCAGHWGAGPGDGGGAGPGGCGRKPFGSTPHTIPATSGSNAVT